MDLTVIDEAGGRSEQVSLPDTIPVGRIVGRLVELLQLPLVGPDGQPLVYGFRHESSSRPIGEEETLAHAAVQANDVLRLVAKTSVLPLAPISARAAPLSPPVPLTHVYSSHAGLPPGHSPFPHGGFGRGAPGRGAVFAGAILALLGVGVGVVLATGVLSPGTRTQSVSVQVPAASAAPQTSTSVGPTQTERASAQGAIMSLLSGYQGDYSSHNIAGLASLFATTIRRHGLAGGGCTESHGRSSVLSDYRSQFEQGSGSYKLLGLSGSQIQLESKTRAHLDAHYQITPGGSGYVDFRFAELGGGWKISEVYAACG